jgi:glycosyltransferase involved in cell wall biosynthesis
MLISVVVIFYNQAEYACRVLTSVISQCYLKLDIVVVDDGSIDGIKEEVERFSDQRIRYFPKPNGGAASARNYGVRQALGDYIAFLDGDDVWLPNKILRQVDFLFNRKWPVCVVTSGHYVVTPRGRIIDRRGQRSDSAGRVRPDCDLYPSCLMYHRSILEEFGGFPESLKINEDGALNVVLAQKYPIYCISEPLVLYRMDDQGKARRSLSDFYSAVSVMEQRLAIVGHVMGADLMNSYTIRSKTNLLMGFLSCNNMEAAKKWFDEKFDEIDLKSLSGIIAFLSVKINVNVYLVLRILLSSLKMAFFFPVTLKYKGCLLREKY